MPRAGAEAYRVFLSASYLPFFSCFFLFGPRASNVVALRLVHVQLRVHVVVVSDLGQHVVQEFTAAARGISPTRPSLMIIVPSLMCLYLYS